jgi:hypothetical protein
MKLSGIKDGSQKVGLSSQPWILWCEKLLGTSTNQANDYIASLYVFHQGSEEPGGNLNSTVKQGNSEQLQITLLHSTNDSTHQWMISNNFYQINEQISYKLPSGPRPFIKLSGNLCTRKYKPRTQFENLTYFLITTGFGDIKGDLCPIKVSGNFGTFWMNFE